MEPEIERRVEMVRGKKSGKRALALCEDLSPDELDDVLPAVNCRRTRDRLAARLAGITARRKRSEVGT